MIFITGPLYSGKKTYAKALLHCDDATLERICAVNVQELAAKCNGIEELAALADALSEKKIVIATEMGGGVVPLDALQRAARENAGRLACLLAQRASAVVRVFCGLPTVMKGNLEL